ncbi:MAG: hypothetical protein ABJB09_02025 [Verrucomicrobiota bacterium]
MRMPRPILALLALLCAAVTFAQESPTPAARNIRISFLPPPLEGSISLGIYDAKGKLVRVLHRESDINEFNIGHDALSTTWDGRSDADENLPAGKYSARGYVVADLKIEGVGFFFNDWITDDDAPRFSRIRSLALRDEDLLLGVDLIPAGAGHVLYDVAHKTIKLADNDAIDVVSSPTASEVGVPGRENTRWIIERGVKGEPATELKQISATGEVLRRLSTGVEEPPLVAVTASMKEDKIFLLEENNALQRVRGLSLVGTKAEGAATSVSDWKVDFEKKIVARKEFAVLEGKPVATAPANAAANEKLKIKLQPNPLLGDQRGTVEVAVGFDEDGSFLMTSDGLPLRTISETPNLSRGLLAAHGANAIDVFEDDGAAVEQFRVSGVDAMMSFDCGELELK